MPAPGFSSKTFADSDLAEYEQLTNELNAELGGSLKVQDTIRIAMRFYKQRRKLPTHESVARRLEEDVTDDFQPPQTKGEED